VIEGHSDRITHLEQTSPNLFQHKATLSLLRSCGNKSGSDGANRIAVLGDGTMKPDGESKQTMREQGPASPVSSGATSDERQAEGGDTSCERLLRDAGLRPTRQRLMLWQLLFAKGHRHVSAETLFEEAAATQMRLSLATVYNTLRQFSEAGLLRRIAAEGSKSFFDTNTSIHPHFYVEGENILIDIPQDLAFEQMPEPLPGHEIFRLDIVVHIRREKSPVA